MNENGYSLADISAATNNGIGGFGSEGLWIFALLILLFGGNIGDIGGGNSRVGEAYATQADIQRAVDLDTLKGGQASISDVVRSTSSDTIGAVKDMAYNQLGEIRDLQNVVNSGFTNMQNCCCEVKSTIMENRYLDAQNAAAIQANDTANTQKILDAISTNRMADMQSQITQLQMQQALCGVPKINPYGYNVIPTAPLLGCSGNI